MAHEPKPDSDSQAVPDDAEKPDDLSADEWAAIQDARADIAAGRSYTHEDVVRWLRTWGTDHETDGPE